jgi:hypothetical protein
MMVVVMTVLMAKIMILFLMYFLMLLLNADDDDEHDGELIVLGRGLIYDLVCTDLFSQDEKYILLKRFRWALE